MDFSTQVVEKLLELYRAQAALINEKGDILAENRFWTEFRIRNRGAVRAWREPLHSLGESAFVVDGADALQVNQGVQSVLNGSNEDFRYTYKSPSPEGPKWFCLTATRFSPSDETRWAVLTHSDLADERPANGNLVTVCGWCKRIPDGEHWISFEEYFAKQRGTRFSHGICSECRDRVLKGG